MLPPLPPGLPRQEWGDVLRTEFEQFVTRVEADEETGLDPYGAQSPDEFFAVASEAFFTMPQNVKGEHPALYAMFARFYRQDPAVDTA